LRPVYYTKHHNPGTKQGFTQLEMICLDLKNNIIGTVVLVNFKHNENLVSKESLLWSCGAKWNRIVKKIKEGLFIYSTDTFHKDLFEILFCEHDC
jgi:hypothetical protein